MGLIYAKRTYQELLMGSNEANCCDLHMTCIRGGFMQSEIGEKNPLVIHDNGNEYCYPSGTGTYIDACNH